MPAANIYIPNFGAAEMKPVENDYRAELVGRREEIQRRIDYYNGKMPDTLAQDGSRRDDNIKLPLVSMLIDRAIAMMMGTDDQGSIEGVRFEIPKPETKTGVMGMVGSVTRMIQPSPPNNSQDYLDNLWYANSKNKFLHNFFLYGALAGHYAVRVMPNGAIFRGQSYPRFVNLDPRNFAVFWSEHDAERVMWYRVQTGSAGKQIRQDVVRVEIIENAAMELEPVAQGWRVFNWREDGRNKWQMVGEPIDWRYPWSPIMDAQNIPMPAGMGYYGKSDAAGLFHINDSVNFLTSNAGRIQKNQAHPKDWITGGTLDTEGDKPGAVWQFDSPETKVGTLQRDTSLDGTHTLIQFLMQMFYNAGREVDPATMKDKVGELTNFGLRLMHEPALAKRQSKWLNAGELLQNMCVAALSLGGVVVDKVKVIPPDPLPYDPREQAEALRTDVEVFDLSKQTALSRRGYDPEDEKANRAKERGEIALMERRQALAQLADENPGAQSRMNNEPQPVA